MHPPRYVCNASAFLQFTNVYAFNKVSITNFATNYTTACECCQFSGKLVRAHQCIIRELRRNPHASKLSLIICDSLRQLCTALSFRVHHMCCRLVWFNTVKSSSTGLDELSIFFIFGSRFFAVYFPPSAASTGATYRLNAVMFQLQRHWPSRSCVLDELGVHPSLLLVWWHKTPLSSVPIALQLAFTSENTALTLSELIATFVVHEPGSAKQKAPLREFSQPEVYVPPNWLFDFVLFDFDCCLTIVVLCVLLLCRCGFA